MLLDNGPHTVRVIPRQQQPGTMGPTSGRMVDLDPIEMSNVSVQPLSAEESEKLGVSTTSTYTVIARGPWPGGALSKVEVVDGPVPGLYDQHGPARVYGMSPRTQHFSVTITARGSEAK